ncbi:Heat shock 70 kDa protein 12B [Paramyrothecium foliicola]|nr:Heat shock 70 kDa protein 12B [Paramyrothecium foliicola]
MSSPWPDLVVGIDFGTTGTAVAYAKPTDDRIHQLTQWQGESASHNKVPSMVVFKGNKVEAWGFGVKDLTIDSITNIRFYKLFKLLFDSKDSAVASEAERCVRTFLKELRIYLEEALPNEEKLKGLDWNESKVKYVFGYPTTWEDSEQTRFSDLIKEAGYQAMEDQDRMTTLDEAQASLMHFLFSGRRNVKSLPKKGGRVLVADIGGGTSDVSMFQVLSTNGLELELSCEDAVEGKDVGSTQVDEMFKDKLREEVKKECPDAHQLGDDAMNTRVDAAVLHIEQSPQYVGLKHTYGQVRGKLPPPIFPLRIVDLVTSEPRPGDKTTFPIEIHKKQYFESAFLSQCDKIWEQCEEQMEKLTGERAIIQHVVLAGGFGSSPYVVANLSERFKNHARSKRARLVQVDDAQLAVSKGLVHDELLNIHGTNGWVHPAHYSYGIQKGDDKDGITWFVKKGEELKVPHTVNITRHINNQVDSDRKLILELKLVRTIKRPTRGVAITGETGKGDWERCIHTVEDISSWVKDSLPVNLKRGFSWRNRNKAAVTLKIKMARKAIALTLYHDNAEHGWPLVLREDWHDPPTSKTKASKDKNKAPRTWKWGLQETIGVIGLGLGAGAILVAVLSYMNDKKGKENPAETAEPGPTQGDTGSAPVTTPSVEPGLAHGGTEIGSASLPSADAGTQNTGHGNGVAPSADDRERNGDHDGVPALMVENGERNGHHDYTAAPPIQNDQRILGGHDGQGNGGRGT